ncbi:MAG TPA: BamA/TamA family outer membrane protein, partial [Terriglobales bacterium]|nr:BamA/TamA family outer membrane protein [Terriglobales bacterium]
MRNEMMARVWAAATMVLLGLGLLAAGQAEGSVGQFERLARQVGQALHSPPRHRRLLGASELMVRGGGRIGARDTHLALYDLKGEASRAARDRLDGALRAALSAPWQLVAHRRSKYGDKESWVYARPEGTRMLTVACLLERGQASLVMAEADPQAVLDSLQDRGIILWSHKSLVRGLWGGLGDGSGFGPGIAFRTPSGPINLVQLHGSAQATSEGYFKSTLGFRFDPTGGDMQTFSLDLTGRYQASPDEDFFGIGPNSPAQRTMYDLQERGLGLTFGVRPARALRLGMGEDYSGARVFGGEDGGYANAQAVFAAPAVPGLARGANLLSTFAFAELDTRDYALSPHSGAYLRLSASDNNGTGHSTFGFWHYGADARAYLPLTANRDVLAWRGLGIWNQAKPGEQVPFFRYARLGDSSILRGYRPYRFYGLNAVASSLEYRHFFDTTFGAFLFGDVGQVYDQRAQLTRSNMRTAWGAGLLFNDNRRKTNLKLYFGITPGGHRWFLTLGPTF